MGDSDEAQRAEEQGMQAELERLWHEAEAAEQAGLWGGGYLEVLYQKAFDRATEQAARIDTPFAKALAQKAWDRLVAVRWLSELPGLQAVGEFRRLRDDLRERDPCAYVRIYEDPDRGPESERYIAVAEAIRIVERQARDFAAEKAAWYRHEALRLLEEHNPEAAEKKILEGLDLFLMDEEERQRCLQLRVTHIKPAVERRAQSKGLLLEASRRGDPREAWQLLAEAERLDPFVPGLDQMRHELVQRTSVYADIFLAHVGDLLRQVRQLAAYDVELQTLVAKAEAALSVLFPPSPPPLDSSLDD
jgi:hypothetical protein